MPIEIPAGVWVIVGVVLFTIVILALFGRGGTKKK